MRHATVNATLEAFQWADHATNTSDRRACDWDNCPTANGQHVSDFAVEQMLHFGAKLELPTYPACAALLDLAFELRGS